MTLKEFQLCTYLLMLVSLSKVILLLRGSENFRAKVSSVLRCKHCMNWIVRTWHFKSTFSKFHYLDILNNFQTSHRVKLQIDLFESLNLVISKFNTLISINPLKWHFNFSSSILNFEEKREIKSLKINAISYIFVTNKFTDLYFP